jgi:hypothetical protein
MEMKISDDGGGFLRIKQNYGITNKKNIYKL